MPEWAERQALESNNVFIIYDLRYAIYEHLIDTKWETDSPLTLHVSIGCIRIHWDSLCFTLTR